MKILSTKRTELLGVVCLLSGIFMGPVGLAEAAKTKKGDDDDDDDDTDDDAISQTAILDGPPSCGGARAIGCVIATGKQTVTDTTTASIQVPSISAVARLSFEFDPGFTQMKYTTEITDRNNEDPTFGVVEAALGCAIAGNPITDANLASGIGIIAFLQFDQRGLLLENQVLDIGDLLPGGSPCLGLTISTIAALYQAMLDESVFFYVEVNDQFNTGSSFVRGQIFLPQGGFTQMN